MIQILALILTQNQQVTNFTSYYKNKEDVLKRVTNGNKCHGAKSCIRGVCTIIDFTSYGEIKMWKKHKELRI